MACRRFFGAVCAVAFLLAQAPPADAAVQTRVFRQSLDGYAGCADAWVSRLDWDSPQQKTVNYGLNPSLVVSRNGGDSPLVRFDLSSIPPNSAVSSATLALYNAQQSNPWGGGSRARRVQAFRVLRPWDEGNQVQSPVDAPGKRGATGEFAFEYFAGEGADVPWSSVGMESGADYSATVESEAGVVDAGWYEWDVTPLVQAWAKGAAPNCGLVLRDATGYEDGNADWRTFRSSQYDADPALRPTLTVVFNPDTPLADAGQDQTDRSWDGGPVSLDASGSRDRPGGDDSSLRYEWRVVRPGYGSCLAGVVYSGRGSVVPFAPDVPGVWEMELEVTNRQGETALDRAVYTLWSIPVGHPRIYLDQAKLDQLQSRAVAGNPRWDLLLEEADTPGGEPAAKALAYALTGDASYGDGAAAWAATAWENPDAWSTKFGELALVYDWCWDRFTPAERERFVAVANQWAEGQQKTRAGNDAPGWGNYWPRYAYSFALLGLATYGENDRAGEWLDEYRFNRFEAVDVPLLDTVAQGGCWPEGTVYDWIANRPRCLAAEAWRTATGENVFLATQWFENRLPYFLVQQLPGVSENWGHFFHPYISVGDAERDRASMADYGRMMALVLLERFPTSGSAPALQAWLSADEADPKMGFLAHEDLIWYDPRRGSAQPDAKSWFSGGTGTVVLRSGWPSGAKDTDVSATYIRFQCGDHFSYHQHYDQNSFTLSKGGDLLVDGGVYSGDGLSWHDVNYYVRTVAHNTLAVFNPEERFDDARPDAVSNDGGQRTMYPASRAPESVEYFDRHRTHYETGDILKFSDQADASYILGDATAAYNSPAYSQSEDTQYSANVPKVADFRREFVYLRTPRGVAGGAEYVVLLDHVAVTRAEFSGSNTKLLFHFLQEPSVSGEGSVVSPGETLYPGATQASVSGGKGAASVSFLSPASRQVRKVGGRGVKAFWVTDANYDWHWSASEPQPRPVNDFEDTPYGEWRLELEPGDRELAHDFLTVIRPSASPPPSMPPLAAVQSGAFAGVHIADAGRDRLVVMGPAGGVGLPGEMSFPVQPASPAVQVLAAGLVPGSLWAVEWVSDGASLKMKPGGNVAADAQGVLSTVVPASARAGDLNLDGRVDAADVAVLSSFLAGVVPESFVAPPQWADVNGDGAVDVLDLLAILGLKGGA